MDSLLCSYAICGDFFPLGSSLRERGLPCMSQKNHFSHPRVTQRLQCLILNWVDIWEHVFIFSSHCTKRGQENILTESGTPISVLCSGTLQNRVWTHCWILPNVSFSSWYRRNESSMQPTMAQCWLQALKEPCDIHIQREYIRECPAAAPVHCGCCKYTKALLSKHHKLQTGNNKCPQAEKDILLFIKKRPPNPAFSYLLFTNLLITPATCQVSLLTVKEHRPQLRVLEQNRSGSSGKWWRETAQLVWGTQLCEDKAPTQVTPSH